ncbi:unnamed protein product [Calicophoron daubneyi]|uniref:MRN complex-interacting protein N-terminal domain-containing protein n=1 Tax=Calicophoron daubneyi TaxID=300641 RepID=A0AAV2SYI6_CALDB
MPVSYLALCCAKCMMFQVQQSVKSGKWTCKVCNTKQSILKVFADGSARECREIVQKLNKCAISNLTPSASMIDDQCTTPTVISTDPDEISVVNQYEGDEDGCESPVEDSEYRLNHCHAGGYEDEDNEESSYRLNPTTGRSDSALVVSFLLMSKHISILRNLITGNCL